MPVAVKLSPYFSSFGEVALQLDEAGADALVLFNRFLQPDVDPEALAIVPRVTLSNPPDARLPRMWIALLHGRVRADLAASSGVEDPADVARYLLAGADVVMTTSALLRRGTEYASVLLDGLSMWMARKAFDPWTNYAACSPFRPASTGRRRSVPARLGHAGSKQRRLRPEVRSSGRRVAEKSQAHASTLPSVATRITPASRGALRSPTDGMPVFPQRAHERHAVAPDVRGSAHSRCRSRLGAQQPLIRVTASAPTGHPDARDRNA